MRTAPSRVLPLPGRRRMIRSADDTKLVRSTQRKRDFGGSKKNLSKIPDMPVFRFVFPANLSCSKGGST